ncbi:Putative methyltransferase KIAA1456 [Strongyloides ratti]|uniref:Putative methyltransferase KIAA1456 n=1 Tax=Strongyloides ratti TaxID=34506 RepID=A0A090LFI6_STRRB|nr:Putative methyltransferase KIAA1456 [Strongyloides ratti]CEF66913.1 Putative methyltransferase KIAA1456 [Strongyloides ratti]
MNLFNKNIKESFNKTNNDNICKQIEYEYVHDVYTQLAGHCLRVCKNTPKSSSKNGRVTQWPVVKKFLKELPDGCVILDIGCGQAKYELENGYIIGFDCCCDVLIKAEKRHNVDVLVADTLNIPIKKKSIDAALCVSVIHHFTSLERRKEALLSISECLKPNSLLFINAWAFEQPNGKFPSSDVLVPWNLHDIKKPFFKFNNESTREERIIKSSIPINLSNDNSISNWFSNKITKILPTTISNFIKFNDTPTKSKLVDTNNKNDIIPPAIPKIVESLKRQSTTEQLFCGIKRWSPMIGRKLLSFVKNVEEQYADEITDEIFADAFTEILSMLHEVTYYRYYHVFKKGELESLIDSIPGLKTVDSFYDSANWCCIVEKIA